MKRVRPAIPDKVKIVVARRQLKPYGAIIEKQDWESQKQYLIRLLFWLATHRGDSNGKLHCDHDPPLRARPYNPRIRNVAARYTPNANDPDHLFFMFDADHRFKTNVRGHGAQFPDRVLIKRERKRERKAKIKRLPRNRRRGKAISRNFTFSINKLKPKMKQKIQSRPFPKGQRGFGRRA